MVLQNRARATREAIIAGAARVFEDHDYGTSSIALVADAAQVTKGALYFHFKSKEELANAVVDAQHAISVGTAESILAEGGSSLRTMIRLCMAFGSQLTTDPVVRAGIRLTLEASAFGQDVRGPYEDWSVTMSALAGRGVAAGELRDSLDPEALGQYIVASFTGVQLVSNVLTGREDLMIRIRQMWEILLPGIMHADSTEKLTDLVGLMSQRTPDNPYGLPASA